MEVSSTSTASDARAHLSKLRIDKSQRPASVATRPRSRRRVWPYAVAILAVAIGGGAYVMRDRLSGAVKTGLSGPPEVRLITVVAQRGTSAPPVHTATGKIVSDHRVRVATKVSGQIVALAFEQGDTVKEGQVIARIEDVYYKARRDNAAAMLARSKARLEYAEQNYTRIEGLHEASNAPDIEYMNVKSERDAAKAQVDADQAALEETAWQVTWCEVTAPITGVVLERNVEMGDFVAAQGGFGGMANSQFATIADMSKLRVEVDVSEMDITKIRRDMPCAVIPDAYKDRRYAGHVMWIDPLANYSKATVQVKVRIDAPDEYLRVEGSARVDFLTEAPSAETEGKSTIWLPKSAVVVDGDRAAVLVYEDERLMKTPVKLGRAGEREYEIVSGVTAGARVADDAGKYEDGQRVSVRGGA